MKKGNIVLIFICSTLLCGCVEDKSHVEENYQFLEDVPINLVYESQDVNIYEQENPETDIVYLKYINQQTGETFICRRY